ncbi:3-hydroxyisobutyrate dehydrogenase [Limimonas halophila]|uniref:3-hydroxyisobutyrate dehydrogenase n=1 Tax=Limimonas halophila TaxID=1082479 RepID=A0A1G7R808_9PROT|nr:NAD(P)-dependent oxidoreductase [Limimonas halophila]SDG06908.1 3-hydroxyisobutyrate dehydrogenase [Limimonas halophila]
MKIGFIGLGNVGGKLAGSLVRNGFDVTVRDLDPSLAEDLLKQGAHWADSAKELAESVDLVITCLPSPEVSATVMEAPDGVLAGLAPGKLWLEMSTTLESEVRRLGARVSETGAQPLDSPVSGGCHRAATGNISIFVGGERSAFDKAFPALRVMGRRILHTGPVGSASVLKVLTNYVASVNLAALAEAWAVAAKAGMDMATTYEAIKASSGNSFVHETESQVILNGSYNINFTLDLVRKDLGLFRELAERNQVPKDVADTVERVFHDTQARYGDRAWSPKVAKRLEDACGVQIRAAGFPAELVDDEVEEPGVEIGPSRLQHAS